MASPRSAEIPLSATSGEPLLYLVPDLDQLTLAETAPTVKIHGRVDVEGAKESIPWTAEFTEGQLAYEGLTLLLPGFGGIKRSSRGERHANAAAGRTTISYDPARLSGNFFANLSDSQELHTRTAEAVLFAVINSITEKTAIPNVSQIDPDRVILSAHSMGGYAATELSLRNYALIETVIYKASVGFGTLSIKDIDALKIAKEMIDYLGCGQIEPNLKNLYRIIRYYARQPSRTIGEGYTCLNVDITEKVAKLGHMGIATAYMGFSEDGLVPPIKAALAAKEVVDIVSIIPGVGHLAPQSHPELVSTAGFGLHQQLTE